MQIHPKGFPEFSVNVAPNPDIFRKYPGKEFTRYFKQQINAECYIRRTDATRSYLVMEYNFKAKYTPEELDAHEANYDRVKKEAIRLELQAIDRTCSNGLDPDLFPCEVCGEKHPNYTCCRACNYNTHTCHYCGDDLGHSEVSACYIIQEWED